MFPLFEADNTSVCFVQACVSLSRSDGEGDEYSLEGGEN